MTLCSFGRSVLGLALVRGVVTVSGMRATVWGPSAATPNIPRLTQADRGGGWPAVPDPSVDVSREAVGAGGSPIRVVVRRTRSAHATMVALHAEVYGPRRLVLFGTRFACQHARLNRREDRSSAGVSRSGPCLSPGRWPAG